jgi:hypothetical protein
MSDHIKHIKHRNVLSVLRIQIRRIHLFLGLPDPDPLVRGTDPDLHDFRS